AVISQTHICHLQLLQGIRCYICEAMLQKTIAIIRRFAFAISAGDNEQGFCLAQEFRRELVQAKHGGLCASFLQLLNGLASEHYRRASLAGVSHHHISRNNIFSKQMTLLIAIPAPAEPANNKVKKNYNTGSKVSHD